MSTPPNGSPPTGSSPNGPATSFWRGRRVLVTGHTGFKGAWLSLWLSAMGAAVTGVSDAVHGERSFFGDLRLGAELDDRRLDIRDGEALAALVREARPEVILHLAAQALVLPGYADPVGTYATNVMGTVNLLEAARGAAGTAMVLVVTSDKAYENREQIWGYRETDPMGGHDPYSSSKGCAELVASAYARSFFASPAGTAVATARAGNVFGGGDWAADRLIPDLVRGFQANTPVRIRRPGATRPWQHVLEPLSGYLLLCERVLADAALRSQGWNFGPDASAELSVRDLADRVCALWPRPGGWIDVSGEEHRHEAQALTLDSAKARALLGWRPRLPLDAALAATLDVYRCDATGPRLRDLALSQIERYRASPGLAA